LIWHKHFEITRHVNLLPDLETVQTGGLDLGAPLSAAGEGYDETRPELET